MRKGVKQDNDAARTLIKIHYQGCNTRSLNQIVGAKQQ